MSPQEILQRTIALQDDFRNGRIDAEEFVRDSAWLTLAAQGNPRPSVDQLNARMAEVEAAARFMGNSPTTAEVDAASSFISPATARSIVAGPAE